MICAECPRCRRRSIISSEMPRLQPSETEDDKALPPISLRCDLCGSKKVRIYNFTSPIEAVRFMANRG
ncbi:MAG TPA: hypothetical protein PLK13_21200, partial [Xanthobacteraceae bacterium]|jgi:hypothetical protein|nr:MAG: hypothetical protein B7Y61_06755 [Rhizobiales bacterium 35-66-30]OZB03429.1 MAG: hypothetical protein B7X67_17010 [Rhizobiales bacterium 39-66-18]HQS11343.1 hypothetical protein [Xanthobacteraceae bacterium]